jgi:CRP/FNR family transcriptional regulator
MLDHLIRVALPAAAAKPSSWVALAACASLVAAAPGPLAEPACDPPGAWWLIVDGEFSLGASCGSGGFFETARLGPGQWLDLAGSLCEPGGWATEVRCRHAGHLAALPMQVLLQTAADDPVVMRAMLAVMAAQLREQRERLDEVAACDVPVRLARWLLRHLAIDSALPVRVVLNQRKQDLARQLCTTSETLSRTLKRLGQSGVIEVHGYELTVLDLTALRRLARHPAYGTDPVRTRAEC